MALVSVENRQEFEEKSQLYREKASEIKNKEKETLLALNRDPTDIEIKKIELVDEMIYAVSLHVAINTLSMKIINTKNNEALNDARKILYKALIYLEEVVSNLIDAPYSEYSDKIDKISSISIENRLKLVKKLGLSIRILIDSFGENTKWKWSFVEIEGRFATVAKNLLNLKTGIQSYFDPRDENYKTTITYISLVENLLDKAASGYRDRYELSTHRRDDMRLGAQYLLALRRIKILLGKADEAEIIKKKVTVWKSKLENDQKTGVSS